VVGNPGRSENPGTETDHSRLPGVPSRKKVAKDRLAFGDEFR